MKKFLLPTLLALVLAGCAAHNAKVAGGCPLAGTPACPMSHCTTVAAATPTPSK